MWSMTQQRAVRTFYLFGFYSLLSDCTVAACVLFCWVLQICCHLNTCSSQFIASFGGLFLQITDVLLSSVCISIILKCQSETNFT